MAFSIFGLSIVQILLILGILFVITFILFRKYFSALINDYVKDGFLSIIDEPLDLILDATGVGFIIPAEPGDLVGAIWIYKKDKHIVGKFLAWVVAAEALTFGIEPLIEMVPGGSIIAAPIGLAFNIFPASLFARIMTKNMKRATKDEKLLNEEKEIADQVGVNISKEDKIRKKIHHLIHKEWYVEAIELSKKEKPGMGMAKKLGDRVETQIDQASSIINNMVNQKIQAPPDVIAILQNGINEAGALLNQSRSYENRFVDSFKQMFGAKHDIQDIINSINLVTQAGQIIDKSARQFDIAFQQYQNGLQQ
jgi:uncharacterized protein YaaR (DUF327 family)|tara:strand:+ start:146 stop:1072 length:927 start_codon:yes stop_codon:yes gene_type:complete